MEPLALVKLTELMDRTSGRPDVRVGLIDGPVQAHHPELEGARVERPSDGGAACTASNGFACLHGTFITGILVARRGSTAPGICPECTVVLRPIFGRSPQGPGHTPTATPSELATAILECLDAGVRLINLSLALTTRTSSGDRALEDALTRAAGRGVIVVAAAGNGATLDSTAITRHPWVIPVAACDRHGRPTPLSTLGGSIGRRGLAAPGDAVTSLGPPGQPLTLGGTSVATPFVTGAVALLWSAFPSATAAEVRRAVTETRGAWRRSVTPPLLNAAAAYRTLSAARGR